LVLEVAMVSEIMCLWNDMYNGAITARQHERLNVEGRGLQQEVEVHDIKLRISNVNRTTQLAKCVAAPCAPSHLVASKPPTMPSVCACARSTKLRTFSIRAPRTPSMLAAMMRGKKHEVWCWPHFVSAAHAAARRPRLIPRRI
jgi:hypothetical protein